VKIDYEPDGAVLYNFLMSRARVNVIQGPWGSGKSHCCCIKLILNAAQIQKPGPDGVRRRRTYVVRNTYDDLIRTTLKTWERVFPENEFGTIKRSRPLEHRIVKPGLDWEVVFLALDDENDRKKLLSAEISDIWFNEGREILRDIVDDADGRLGRYPAKKDGGCTVPMMILDTNAPSEAHWIAIMSGQAPMPDGITEDERRRLTKPDSWKFFMQPPAMFEVRDSQGNVGSYVPNPRAENIKWLPDGYYENLVGGKSLSWIRVNVLNKPGQLSAGKPVFPEYRDEVHAAKSVLEPVPGIAIMVGLDFGRSPAAVFGQHVFGRWLILSELIANDMGARAFSRLLKTHLASTFPGHKFAIFGDPAGEHLAEADDISPFLMVRAEGLMILPAPTNDVSVRINAVKEALSQMADGKPRILVSQSCTMLKAALGGGYRYRRLHVSGERYSDTPEKDRFSHIADALQYLMIGGGEGRSLLNRGVKPPKVRQAPPPPSVFKRRSWPVRKARG